MERQGAALHSIIQDEWGTEVQTVLDAACGIGTQTFGLATYGYHMTASDLSGEAVARARREAALRSLTVDFAVADMREVYSAHGGKQFDLVVACDNSVPHLLTDADLLRAFQQFYACCRPGGGCLISVRDYDAEERGGTQVKPASLRIENGIRYLVFQVWEWDGPCYNLSLYLMEDNGDTDCKTHVMRSRYYAVRTSTLISLMEQAGFQSVHRIDGVFYQPVLVGTRI